MKTQLYKINIALSIVDGDCSYNQPYEVDKYYNKAIDAANAIIDIAIDNKDVTLESNLSEEEILEIKRHYNIDLSDRAFLRKLSFCDEVMYVEVQEVTVIIA